MGIPLKCETIFNIENPLENLTFLSSIYVYNILTVSVLKL